MKKTILLSALSAMAVSTSALAQGVNPATAEIRSEDAHRFAAVFEAANGTPTAEQLQTGYLDSAGRGVEIFTPGRIQNADHLAATVAVNVEAYRRAIEVCLPIAEAMNGELREIYAGIHALLPEAELPEIHVVFGAGNSGGTAGAGAQVLGLEVICANAESEDEIRRTFRKFFAHETVHTFQSWPEADVLAADPLLAIALMEGTADFIAELVTGDVPGPEREAWARANEDQVWQHFAEDRATIRDGFTIGENGMQHDAAARAAADRWYWNYGRAPEGWPYEMAYWTGRMIAQGYYENAGDRDQALRDLIALEDPAAILAASGLEDRATLH